MDLRQLRYFVVVADERNFSRAAARLRIAQPPLSRSIQKLEHELRTELIDRTMRPIDLTAAGRILYEQAVQLLGKLDEMRQMVGHEGRTQRRSFIIGFVASTMYARLPDIIREFRATAHNVDLSLIEMVSADQVSALVDGRIDVGFGRVRVGESAVRRTVLRDEELVAALPGGHPLVPCERPLLLAELAELPMIIYPRRPRPSYADQILSIFGDAGLTPTVSHESSELLTALGLVAAEEGICVVPSSVQSMRLGNVVYKPIAEPVTSPIIMSHRVGDTSPDLATMGHVIAAVYERFGYAQPAGIARLGN